MGFGSYDNDEHERREENMSLDLSEETLGEQHEGEVTTEGGEDTDALLSRLDSIKNSTDDDDEA